MSAHLLTPGVYRQPLDPTRPGGRLARGDVPLLLGYATRGPVGRPVRVDSIGQFETVFGGPRVQGYLWHATKGFFETGGRSAYIVRVATGSARPATVEGAVEDAIVKWRAEASFPWRMIDPRRLGTGERADTARSWVRAFENYKADERSQGSRSTDPGTWGNGLSVSLSRTSRLRTVSLDGLIGDGTALRLASLAGLEEASVVELSQPGGTEPVTMVPAAVDRARRIVHWRQAPTRLDLAREIRVSTVEFDVTIQLDGRTEQTFLALAPHPAHSFSLQRTMEAECRSLTLHPVFSPAVPADLAPTEDLLATRLAATDWADKRTWPREGTYSLSGGTDGLHDMTKQTWLDLLPVATLLDDAALLAAPDLVLPDSAPIHVTSAPSTATDCLDLAPLPLGFLTGEVTEATGSGVPLPLEGVVVDVAGPGGTTATDSAGMFRLTGIEIGLLTLRLHKQGFEPIETLVQSSPLESAAPVRLVMSRIVTPKALSPDDVLRVQQAMCDPGHVGPYMIAILDPPAADIRLDGIASWRSRLGDRDRAGFFAPWLTLPGVNPVGGHLVCPPSGHVCGAFAAAELSVGIHRTGANLPLKYVDGITLAISDEDQASLNPVGINVIRAFPGRGIRAFGSRTLSAEAQWTFLTARRIVDAIEKPLEQALQWIVFEPNNMITRQAAAVTASTLLGMIHRDGTLAGATPDEALAVRCDEQNNPEAVRDAGQFVIDIAVAPTHPYEFVLFRLGRTLDALDVTENLP